MTVAVLEPHASGHRALYVRWVTEGLLAAGRDVLIGGSRELLAHAEVRPLLENPRVFPLRHDAADLDRVVRRGPLPQLTRQYAYRRYFVSLGTASRRCRPLRGIVLPYLDYCLYAIAALGSPFGGDAWCGITLRAGAEVLGPRWRPRALALRRVAGLPTLRALYVIDPRVEARLCSAGAAGRPRMRYLPDPVVTLANGDRRRMRTRLAIDEAATVVLAFGSLDRRKGIEHLLAGLLHSAPQGPLALLAGQQSAGLRALLAEPRYAQLRSEGRIRIIDRFIEDAELADLLAGADAAWLGYVGHQHMSGVLLLAAAHGLPIIATREGAIGYLASDLPLATLVDPRDPTEVAAALRALELQPRTSGAAEAGRALALRHSPQCFGATIAALFA